MTGTKIVPIDQRDNCENAKANRDRQIVLNAGRKINDKLSAVGKGNSNEAKQIEEASSYITLQQYPAAIRILIDVLQLMRAKYQKKHAHLAVCVNDMIADVYFLQKDYRKALEIYTDILELSDESVKPAKLRAVQKKEATTIQHILSNKSQTLIVSADRNIDLGKINMEIGNYKKSTQRFTRALGVMQMIYGPNHEGVAAVRECLADSFLMQERYEEAERTYRGILTAYERNNIKSDDACYVSISEKLDIASKKLSERNMRRERGETLQRTSRWMVNI